MSICNDGKFGKANDESQGKQTVDTKKYLREYIV
jgi:hypothetical protein